MLVFLCYIVLANDKNTVTKWPFYKFENQYHSNFSIFLS